MKKENRLLGERCNQLLKDKGDLIDRCRELEAQIEKMKCCGNCKYSSWKVIKPIPFNPFKINGVEYKNSLELVMRIEELEKENERLKGELELWESGACRVTNLDKCGVVKELKQQIEKLKTDLNEAIEDASWLEETETFSVLNRIYNDNFEVITSVSN